MRVGYANMRVLGHSLVVGKVTFLINVFIFTKSKFRNIGEFFSFFKTTNANINYHDDKNSCSNTNENAK